MPATFALLNSIKKLDDLVARSHNGPVVIFKHSSSCGISAAVHRQMTELDAEVNIVIVQEARDVSDEIEQRTGIRHQSPQAMVIRNGEAVYQASHYSIDPGEIDAELKS
jgi:thioredoxin 1